jgi:hypothetical protein
VARDQRLRLIATRTAVEDELKALDADATEAGHARLWSALERLFLAWDTSRRHDASRADRDLANAMLSQAEVDRVAAAARGGRGDGRPEQGRRRPGRDRRDDGPCRGGDLVRSGQPP